MPGKFLYAAVALVMLAAWFSANPPPPRPPAPPVAATLQSDPAALGLDIANATAQGQCNLEFVNRTLFEGAALPVARNAPLNLTGWAMDQQKALLPETVVVRFAGTEGALFFAPAQTGLPRADVQQHFKLSDALLASGFQVQVDRFDLPAGEYRLALLFGAGGTTYLCDNGRRIDVQ